MSNTKPIGVAYTDQDIIGADFIYSAGELGYTAAAQGSVTQATSKSTGVTLNKSAGRITMSNAALAGGAVATFTLTNSLISTKDIVILNVSGGATAGVYTAYIGVLAAGSADINLRNLSATSYSEAVIINYAIIHGQ
jgi:hypothetical protein